MSESGKLFPFHTSARERGCLNTEIPWKGLTRARGCLTKTSTQHFAYVPCQAGCESETIPDELHPDSSPGALCLGSLSLLRDSCHSGAPHWHRAAHWLEEQRPLAGVPWYIGRKTPTAQLQGSPCLWSALKREKKEGARKVGRGEAASCWEDALGYTRLKHLLNCPPPPLQ